MNAIFNAVEAVAAGLFIGLMSYPFLYVGINMLFNML